MSEVLQLPVWCEAKKGVMALKEGDLMFREGEKIELIQFLGDRFVVLFIFSISFFKKNI